MKLAKMWKSIALSKQNKVNSLIFSIATYGSETGSIRCADVRLIDAFKMWVYRRLLRRPWTAQRTNASTMNKSKSDYERE